MKELFITHENDEWVELLLVQLLNLQVSFKDWKQWGGVPNRYKDHFSEKPGAGD